MTDDELNAAAAPRDARDNRNKFTDEPHRIGLLGEREFARMFGLKVDAALRPGGDGGKDFAVSIGGRVVKIDVKTCDFETTPRLIMSREEIIRGSDVLVLFKQLMHSDLLEFVGWETRTVMLLSPVHNFGNGKRHFRNASQLRPLAQLAALMAMRDTEGQQERQHDEP